MPAYEITWHFQAADDEIALEVFKGAERVQRMAQPTQPEASVSLKKVLDG